MRRTLLSDVPYTFQGAYTCDDTHFVLEADASWAACQVRLYFLDTSFGVFIEILRALRCGPRLAVGHGRRTLEAGLE